MAHPDAPRKWRGTLIPAEHGTWDLLLEPLALGLLVAPSWPGGLIAMAAIAIFFSRTALLKLWVSRGGPEQRKPAREIARWGFGWLALAPVALAAAAILGGEGLFLLPLALAAPLAFLQLRAQLRHEARSVRAEVAGALALSAFTPAIALAAGWSLGSAALLWAVPALRAMLSVHYVRAKLRLERGDDSLIANVLDAHTCAAVVMVGLAVAGWLPGLAAAAFVLMSLRAMWGLLSRRARASAKQVGLAEMSLGIVFVVMTAAGFLTGI